VNTLIGVCDKRVFAYMLKLGILRWGGYPGECKIITRGRQKDQGRKCDNKSKDWSEWGHEPRKQIALSSLLKEPALLIP
jgi:hypothetical protein